MFYTRTKEPTQCLNKVTLKVFRGFQFLFKGYRKGMEMCNYGWGGPGGCGKKGY